MVTPASTTAISLTVTDGGGCSSSAITTSITVNALPAASLIASGTITCGIPSVTLTAGGGTSYSFSSGASQIGGSSGNTATVSQGGTYTVTVANASGCRSTTSVSIGQDNTAPVPTISASPSTTLSCAETSLTLTAGGGNAYSFSPNVVSQSGNMAVVNASGTYSVTVTNTHDGLFQHHQPWYQYRTTVRPRPVWPAAAR